MTDKNYNVPSKMKRGDGTSRFAFAAFLMLNDSYLPGALMVAYGLRKQKTRADLICMITEEITSSARYALSVVFDHVVPVEKIFVPHKRRQERQDRPYFFTRLNALRLGKNGDLGLKYTKIVVLDADVLPLKHYDHLFMIDAPAGIINERKSHFLDENSEVNDVMLQRIEQTGKWKWHHLYGEICPHGDRIPKEITDRVKRDASNMGINGSLFVFEPSVEELIRIKEDICRPDTRRLVGDLFDWPDMQYLTMRWSGKWTSIDLRFSGFNGYPSVSALFGLHYAGFKPWYFGRPKAMERYGRYDDFQFWFKTYTEMMSTAYPELKRVKKLSRLLQKIQRLIS